MGTNPPAGSNGITRRGFLLGTAAGLAAGAPLTWAGIQAWHNFHPGQAKRTPPSPLPEYAMPGRYPGKVVEVRHPYVVNDKHEIDGNAVNAMIDRGMADLTGADDAASAWRSFFAKDDVVGIKVNPVGRKPKPDEAGRVPNAVGSISSFEVLLKVVAELKAVGIPPRNIIVFERYAEEFLDAGYGRVMLERQMDGVRWYASAVHYSDRQVDVQGFDDGRDSCPPEVARHVVGYDPDVFVHMGFAGPQHSRRDDRRFRSHLSVIVTRLVNKIITIPVLKDHRSAGVTLSLKNLSHGMNNNVARSHLSGFHHGGRFADAPAFESGPNQCNTFIPTAVAQPKLREKATLHILDGLIGVYEGGPGNWNKTWGTWHHQGLFFATDPVALDHVGWDVVDAARAERGWPPVAGMGLLLKHGPLDESMPGPREKEPFDRRQPEHVILAGTLGLGEFDVGRIEHRLAQLPAGGA